MPVPDFQSLMLPVLRATADGEITAPELRDRVAHEMGLTAADLAEMLPSGRQPTFTNRTAWANVCLQRAGLIERTGRGQYKATSSGLAELGENPARIDLRFLRRSPGFVEWRRRSAGLEDKAEALTPAPAILDSTATPEEQIARSYETLNAALATDLLERVGQMSPGFFERLVIELLMKLGYGGGDRDMGKAVGRAGDGGIDGVIKEDALGLDLIYVQAKRYAAGHAVGRPEVQAFAGSLDGVGATKGILITTASFSTGAREFAARISKRLILVDGVELARLMVEREVGVRTQVTYQGEEHRRELFHRVTRRAAHLSEFRR
ncbi:MAG: restriction endonuclease [Alphaproteobacteria bacterium]|nr:restriction endonuclease [Alphaproteobacteria bacterium]